MHEKRDNGRRQLIDPENPYAIERLAKWLHEYRSEAVYASTDYADDARDALQAASGDTE
jgi:hypothetical protein